MSLFDESKVAASHQKLAASIIKSIQTLGVCTDLIRKVAQTHEPQNKSEFYLILLACRVVNACGACTKLLDSGYFIQAASFVRDVSEVGFLFLFFNNNPQEIEHWGELEGKARYREFGRSRLQAKVDQEKAQYLNMFFDKYSEVGVHPSSESARLHFDGEALHIGPHYNSDLYVMIHKDLAQLTWHVCDIAYALWQRVTNIDIKTIYPRESEMYKICFNSWSDDH